MSYTSTCSLHVTLLQTLEQKHNYDIYYQHCKLKHVSRQQNSLDALHKLHKIYLMPFLVIFQIQLLSTNLILDLVKQRQHPIGCGNQHAVLRVTKLVLTKNVVSLLSC